MDALLQDIAAIVGPTNVLTGGDVAAFEAMWQSHYRLLAVESGRHTPPLPPDAPFYVIAESLDSDPEGHAERFSRALETAWEQGLIGDAVVARSDTQRQGLWAIREDIEGLVKCLAPLLTFDVSLPISAMDAYVAEVEAAIRCSWPQGRVATFGHLGDSNLHLSVGVGDEDPAPRAAVEALVYTPLARLGGSISAEHGIGLEKRDYLAFSRSPEEIALMRTLKQALDPHGLLNRHKVLAPAAEPA